MAFKLNFNRLNYAIFSSHTHFYNAPVFKQSMGPLAGYGHSLHRINLRDDSSSLIWSPSHADYFIEGLHSINGIMTDANNEHLVWVSSTSACKMWALDVRHRPAKVVVSWSLPSLCDDIGSQLPVSGIFGRGVIFSQPASIHSMPMNDASPVMFSVKKDPTTSVLGVHQLPSQLTRFQAKSLESAGFQEGSNSSIARSAVFTLPDISGSVFNIGLATIHCSVQTCLNEKQRRLLDYRIPPAHVTYVITMTSLGDMYCHTLLETNAAEQSQAQQYPGLPVGTKAIPFPGNLNTTPAIPGHLNITLNNKFPIPSSAITPHIILKSDDCCPFKSYDIKDILNREPLPEIRLQEPDDSTEQAFECKAPCSMYDLRNASVTNHSDFDTSSTTFRVACCHGANDCDINSKSAVHSFPRFGMVLPTEIDGHSSSHRRNNTRHIALHPSHLTVSTCAEKQAGGYDSSDESGKNSIPLSTSAPVGKRLNEELDLDIFNNLQASYFRKDDADEFEFGAVKNESSSDSE